jgi:PPK2 family polyphosphate:nucleotide phosphotransferase
MSLSAMDAGHTGGIASRKKAEAELVKVHGRLVALQERLFAESKRAVLVVLQAMDTGGKDGTIRHVFGPLNPQGVRVKGFKAPTPAERARDYLWRVHQVVPPKGFIGIFNRSHYEDVLVPRVHRYVSPKIIAARYRQINDFERHLAENDITLVKLYLHISKAEQKNRLQRRLDRSDKHWKFNTADLAERKLWHKYMRAYERVLSTCNTPWAPWHVIPADHKWYRNLVVAKIVCEKIEGLKPKFPPAEPGLADIIIDG